MGKRKWSKRSSNFRILIQYCFFRRWCCADPISNERVDRSKRHVWKEGKARAKSYRIFSPIWHSLKTHRISIINRHVAWVSGTILKHERAQIQRTKHEDYGHCYHHYYKVNKIRSKHKGDTLEVRKEDRYLRERKLYSYLYHYRKIRSSESSNIVSSRDWYNTRDP